MAAITKEERDRRNAVGAAQGCMQCPVCGDYANGKQFHDTSFYEGPINAAAETDESRAAAEALIADFALRDKIAPSDLAAFSARLVALCSKAVFFGQRGIIALCEECFDAMTPEQRLPYYEARTSLWEQAVKPPKKVVRTTAKPGQPPVDTLVNDDADANRHSAEMAMVAMDRVLVRQAVLAGK